MPRLTFRIPKTYHKKLKLMALEKEQTIKEFLTKILALFIQKYISDLKNKGKSDFITFFSQKKAIIKNNNEIGLIEEKMAVSFELDSNLHFLLKSICKMEEENLKDFLRGVILYLLEGKIQLPSNF